MPSLYVQVVVVLRAPLVPLAVPATTRITPPVRVAVSERWMCQRRRPWPPKPKSCFSRVHRRIPGRPHPPFSQDEPSLDSGPVAKKSDPALREIKKKKSRKSGLGYLGSRQGPWAAAEGLGRLVFPHLGRQIWVAKTGSPKLGRHSSAGPPPTHPLLPIHTPPPHSASRVNFLAHDVRTRFGSYEPESHWSESFLIYSQVPPAPPCFPLPSFSLSLHHPRRFPVSRLNWPSKFRVVVLVRLASFLSPVHRVRTFVVASIPRPLSSQLFTLLIASFLKPRFLQSYKERTLSRESVAGALCIDHSSNLITTSIDCDASCHAPTATTSYG